MGQRRNVALVNRPAQQGGQTRTSHPLARLNGENRDAVARMVRRMTGRGFSEITAKDHRNALAALSRHAGVQNSLLDLARQWVAAAASRSPGPQLVQAFMNDPTIGEKYRNTVKSALRNLAKMNPAPSDGSAVASGSST